MSRNCSKMISIFKFWQGQDRLKSLTILDLTEIQKNIFPLELKVLKDILESMSKVTYKTRWSEAQKLLFKNPYFTQDMDLQNMDKEDALIVFEEHIRSLEKEHLDEVEKRKKWMRRQERKNREAYLSLLEELRDQGKLNSFSLWQGMFATISADERFNSMLQQASACISSGAGSSLTPLDLFKLYVEDLKVKFHEDKKSIKEMLKERKFEIDTNSTLEQFISFLKEDEKKWSVLDQWNIKLVFSGMMEKVEIKEKEKQREEQKKLKKLEHNFRSMLRKYDVTDTTKYEDIKEKISNEESFKVFNDEKQCEELFNQFIHSLQETCLHHVKKKKDKKRKSNKRSKSRSRSKSVDSVTASVNNDADGGENEKNDSEEDEGEIKASKSKKESESTEHKDGEKSSSSKKHKKSKKRKRQKSVS
jgi:pre-mRNA-processing factor 40